MEFLVHQALVTGLIHSNKHLIHSWWQAVCPGRAVRKSCEERTLSQAHDYSAANLRQVLKKGTSLNWEIKMSLSDSGTIAVLAEKPSVARDIAKVLGATTGYLRGNGYVVTSGDWASCVARTAA